MENVEAQTQNPSQATPTQPQAPPQATPTQTQPTKPFSCAKIKLFVNLISRILTFIFLLVALVVLATNTGVLVLDYGDFDINFQTILGYRYVMAAIVIGFAYTLVQIGFVLYQVITGRRLFNGKAMLHFDFYADKVISGLLATGAGAGFGVTIDLKDSFPSVPDYFNRGAAVSSLVLFAYFFNEASQIVSSYALPKTNC